METLKIVIADDDPDDFQTISEAFAELPETQHLVHVNDGCDLMDYLEFCLKAGEPLPRLILLDVNMPRMNGVQALTLIRKNSAFEQVPVIVYTTCADRALKQMCYLLGANGFVAKGFTFTDIVNFVRDVQAYGADIKSVPGHHFSDSSDNVKHRY